MCVGQGGHFIVPITDDGSANWSAAGERLQDNNARYSTDPQEIRNFERNFEALWNRPENIRVQ
jgi:hypothetical protein